MRCNNAIGRQLLDLKFHSAIGDTMAIHSRRDFLRRSLIGFAALPLGATLVAPRAFAGDLPRLDPDDDQAQALEYVEDASQAAGHDRWEEGQRCANCRFFKPDVEGCELFPDNSVEPGGWCNTWTEKS
jgi:hypothetical protein